MIYINGKFLRQKITGVQRFALEVCKEIIKLAPEVKIIAPKGEDVSLSSVVQFGLNKGVLWEQADLVYYLKRNGSPLLLNLTNSAPVWYRPKVVVIHDIAWLRFPHAFSKKFFLWYRFLIPRVIRTSLKVITVSKFSKQELQEVFELPEEKIHVVYEGVSSKFKPLEIKKDDFILWVGSLQPCKNLENLLRAFQILRKKGIKTKLYLVGATNPKVFGKFDVKESFEGVEFLGYKNDDELLSLYNRAQLFVFPSLYESFGLPALEAMACGCPVVASAMASLPEICEDSAYYVNPEEPEDIAEGMLKVLSDDQLRQSLVKKGLERVKLFSWHNTAKEILKIVQQVDV